MAIRADWLVWLIAASAMCLVLVIVLGGLQ
jgi:hypothetical protein